MNKIFNKLFWVMAICGLTMTACSDVPDREPSPEIPANCNGVYFDENYIISKEFEPDAPTVIDVKISREKSTEAIVVPMKVIEDKNNVFSVPESVSFAAGESTITVSISFPNAPLAVPHKLLWAIEGDDVNVYSQNISEIQVEVTRIKWDNIGTGYLVSGAVAQWFGVDPDIACAVEIQRAELPTSIRYRFDNPFARVATSVDELGGYNGYPYNDKEDLVPGTYVCLIEVTEDGASLAPGDMGMDWGHGMFSWGSIYGYLNADKTTYPLGTLNEDGDVITFAPRSLYVSMADYNDGGKYPCNYSTTLYLSAEAYSNR